MMLNRTRIDLHSGPLVLLKIEEEWSVYVNRYEDEIVLQHGTCRVLVDFDTIIANLSTLWTEFTLETSRFVSMQSRHDSFIEWLEQRTFDPDFLDDEVAFCPDCSRPGHTEDMLFTNSGSSSVCEPCYEANYYGCADCEERFFSTDLRSTLHDEEVCEGCRSANYVWCNTCDGLYHNESDDHDHDEDETGEGCCASPALSFTVRNDGLDPLPNGERTTISLAKGMISPEGMATIEAMLCKAGDDAAPNYSDRQAGTEWHKHHQLSYVLEEVGPQWQAKRGNFTKRLSSLAYKKFDLRLASALLSDIGSVAADHSRGVDVTLEVSRDLNSSAGSWYHEGSCWFGGGEYAVSRCALKTNGGYGLRTFDSSGHISGRAWVMPMVQTEDRYGNKSFTPTFETMSPDAFVVFNGYGDLEGYAAARIVAHMNGLTYRKISLEIDPMYVNSNAGYLVGSEEVVEPFTDGSLGFNLNAHADLWAREQEAKALAEVVEVKAEQVQAAVAELADLIDAPF